MSPDAASGHQKIQHEDAIILHRLSLMMGSQSFLLTAFVLLRNSPEFYPKGDGEAVFPVEYLRRTELLIYLISVAGILTSVCAFLSVMGAYLTLTHLRNDLKSKGVSTHSSSRTWNLLGGLSTFMPAPVMAAIWMILLQQEWPLRHVSTAQFLAPVAVALGCLGMWLLFFRLRETD
jgi:hypothetical protein